MQTTGIIELGGASAQVTFVSSEPVPPEFSRAVKFGNVTYNLYSHSFLHFSQNVAYDSLKEGIVSGDFDSVTSRAWGSTKGYSLVTHL
ncbi:probable apyrase 6 isoform X2 [Malus domestica]|uniref:probable apyrase 6 isoform X2 n=1 Tax=Malus domestica TaxID=3750 RepID=UPI003976E837